VSKDPSDAAHDDGTQGAHSLVHVEYAHGPPEKVPWRLDLNDDAADGAETDLSRPHHSEQDNRKPKIRRRARKYKKNRRNSRFDPQNLRPFPSLSRRSQESQRCDASDSRRRHQQSQPIRTDLENLFGEDRKESLVSDDKNGEGVSCYDAAQNHG